MELERIQLRTHQYRENIELSSFVFFRHFSNSLQWSKSFIFYIYSSPSNSTMSKNQVDRSEFAAQQDLTEWIDLPFSGRPLLYSTTYSPEKGLRAPKTSTRYVLLSNPALDQQIGHWLHLAQSISTHLQQNQIESGMIDYISPESKLNHLVQSPNGWKRETSYSLRGIQIQTLNGSMQLIKGFLRDTLHPTYLGKPHGLFKSSALPHAYKYPFSHKRTGRQVHTPKPSKHFCFYFVSPFLHQYTNLGIGGILVSTEPVSSTLFCRSLVKHGRKRLITGRSDINKVSFKIILGENWLSHQIKTHSFHLFTHICSDH